ncbi:MAG: hypothetical protein VB131_02540 [Burkholderia gladioli]
MSAMLYELTASAAQMCTPVPAAAAGGWVDWVDHWQTLGGNIVGGVMGIAGALVVATRVNGREQWIAAGMVRPDLHQLVTRATELEASLPRAQPQNAGSVWAELNSWAADGQRIGHAASRSSGSDDRRCSLCTRSSSASSRTSTRVCTVTCSSARWRTSVLRWL